MNTFSDKPNFSLRQLITVASTAFLIGGGIARFEFKTTNIETKLDTMIAMMDTTNRKVNAKFVVIDARLLANENNILKLATDLKALLKPEEIEIKQRR